MIPRLTFIRNSVVIGFFLFYILFTNACITNISINDETVSGDSVITNVFVSNIRNNGILHSGFIIGTVTTNLITNSSIDAVEISIDSGLYTDLSGTTNWKYKLPTGINTWKNGSVHNVSLRVRYINGKYSGVLSLNIRKGLNRDINGDGYTDAAAGAYLYDPSQYGRAYVFLGSYSGISNIGAGSADAVITGQAFSGQFGVSTALGDVNGDGYSDLIVGALGGVVFVYLGSESGITAAGAGDADAIFEQASINFGVSAVCGDINGDGYDDIIIGGTGYNSAAGSSYIFHGSSGISGTKTAAEADTTITGESSNNYLGISVISADVNGDGYLDLIIGADGYLTNKGRVYVFHGSSSGISDNSASNAYTVITGESNGDEFGTDVYVGDINSDRNADIIIGSPYYGTSQGRVYLFMGSSSGISGGGASGADAIISGEGANDQLGTAVSSGDFNGDGYADIILGAYGYNSNQGRSYIFLGGLSGISTSGASGADLIITGEGVNNQFAISLAAGDFNGDGYADALIGAPEYNSYQGRAYIFQGIISGGSASAADAIFTGEAGGNWFGFCVGR